MLDNLLPYVTSPLALYTGAFFIGVLLAQKVKDFITSTPASFRTSMSSLENKAKSDVHTAIGGIFAKLNPPEAPDASAK